MGSTSVVSQGQQYNIGERLAVLLYTYTNRHVVVVVVVVIPYAVCVGTYLSIHR